MVAAYREPACAGDAQDHGGHGEADDGIEDWGAGGYCDGAGDDGESDVCVGAGMSAVCDQRGAFQSAPGTGATVRVTVFVLMAVMRVMFVRSSMGWGGAGCRGRCRSPLTSS